MKNLEKTQRLIVTGASGVIGGQLFADATTDGYRVVGIVHTHAKPGFLSGDLRNRTVGDLVPDLGPNDCVYLLAAHTDPNWITKNPSAARSMNVEATIASASAVLDTGARLVFLSSDQVFDGETGAYSEEDPTNPLNLYGWQKVEVEDFLKGRDGNWCIVRTGWNVGWGRHQRCPVRGTYETLLDPRARMAEDNIFSLTDVADTSQALLALRTGTGQEIWHVAAQPAISRTDLADAIISQSRFGDAMAYAPAQMRDIPYAEPRPVRSSLLGERFCTNFEVDFADPLSVIDRKVALLDAWLTEERADS